MPSDSPAGAIVRIMWMALETVSEAFDRDDRLRADYEFDSWWLAAFLEAMLDLLQPGVIRRIADGLGKDRP